MHMLWSSLVAYFGVPSVSATPTTVQVPLRRSPTARAAFDIHAHRGGRGAVVENVLPAFAWALIGGANTLELDNGISKDGHVLVWHDEDMLATKCSDTAPAFPDDPDFPYVGKELSQLTLAQLKTLDCGSKRQLDYPFQTTYPGTKLSTLEEFFAFVECADPDHQMRFNVEAKIDAEAPNKTASVDEFVTKQHAIFAASPYHGAITYQSFDWRTLIAMKKLDPSILTSGLLDEHTLGAVGTKSPWFAGKQVDNFPGKTRSEKVANMAASLGLDIISPSGTATLSLTENPVEGGFIPFVDAPMIKEAHRLGLRVLPWSINTLAGTELLVAQGVDGIITDYPDVLRRWARAHGLPVAPRYPSKRVLACLEQHNQVVA